MRMGVGLLVGILIILFGLGIIVNVVFHVSIPVFKIFVGLLLVYIGLRIIFGGWVSLPEDHWRSGDAVFRNRTYHGLSGESNQYNTIFGKTTIDLRGIELKEKVTRLEVKVVFGETDVILDKETPVRIRAQTVLGGVQMPENAASAFGSAYYQSSNFDESKNYLLIEGSSVFGSITIHY
jgi:hypothetical protein